MEGPYPIEIDPDLSPKEMLKGYDIGAAEMAKNYDIGGYTGNWSNWQCLNGLWLDPTELDRRNKEVLLCRLSDFLKEASPSIEEVLEELSQLHLTPETVLELLAFGRKYPDVQRDFPIVQLGCTYNPLGPDGSPFFGKPRVAGIWKVGGHRTFITPRTDNWILPDCRIIVSRC